MDLFTVLQALDEHVTPDRCKLHLAVWNGEFDPLDVYLEDGFDDRLIIRFSRPRRQSHYEVAAEATNRCPEEVMTKGVPHSQGGC